MELRILKTGEVVTFELERPSAGFLRLCISNSLAETMWDLIPVTLTAIPVLRTSMAFVQLPQESATAVIQALKEAAEARREVGILPEQTATTPTQVLNELGQTLKESGRFPEQTATTAVQALKELTQALKGTDGLLEQSAIGVRQSRKKVGGSELPGSSPVTRVVYGEVPDGYRETAKARPLVQGEKYRIVVFGDEAFDLACDYFVA